MSDTPETDAFFLKRGVWSDEILAFCRKLERERDEARDKYDSLATEHMLVVNKLCKERDDALAQVKELIYISDRAIALADIDFENDKFGVVSELRSDLEKIKKQNYHSDKMSSFVSESSK